MFCLDAIFIFIKQGIYCSTGLRGGYLLDQLNNSGIHSIDIYI